MSLSSQPIGIFDSGIGGLSVLKALRAELPQEDFIYIADSGHAPYGERDDAHVVDRSQRLANWLVSQRIKALVIACNTATAAAIAALRKAHPLLPIIGVEPALKPAVQLSKTNHIGVMATRSTLASDKFKALLQSQTGLATFTLQPCDGLADAIEHSAGTGDAAKVIASCARFTRAMGVFGVQKEQMDTLVLGCTHYLFAEQHVRRLLGPDVQLVASGEAIARQTRRQIAVTCGQVAPGKTSLFSTGNLQSLQAAAQAWLTSSETPKLLQI